MLVFLTNKLASICNIYMAQRYFYTYIHESDSTKNDSFLPKEFATTYWNSLVFDVNHRTIWHQGMPFGNVYPGTASYGEVFNDIDHNIAKAAYGHAEGYKTTVTYNDNDIEYATAAHAEGIETEATYKGTHAEGYKTKAYNTYTHAEGNETIAKGNSSHAEGCLTTASGHYSHVEGSYNVSSNISSHAEGSNTVSSGLNSHAEGFNAHATGESSHAEGQFTESAKIGSHAEGIHTTANNEAAHSEGKNSTAAGIISHAEGLRAFAIGKVSHAEGFNTLAQGSYTHTEGFVTTTNGNYSHAEGSFTKVDSAYSHVEGNYNDISIDSVYSHVEGTHNKSYSPYTHVEGKENTTTKAGEYLHIEGFNNKNISGKVSHIGGSSNSSVGNYSLIHGSENTSTGNWNIIVGNKNKDLGDANKASNYNIVAGLSNIVNKSISSLVTGTNNIVEGNSNTVNGNKLNVKGNYNLVNGSWSKANTNKQILTNSSLVIGIDNKVMSDAEDVLSKGCNFVVGEGLVVNGNYESAIGSFNISYNGNNQDSTNKNANNKTKFSIGIGTSDKRKNALDVRESGTAYLYHISYTWDNGWELDSDLFKEGLYPIATTSYVMRRGVGMRNWIRDKNGTMAYTTAEYFNIYEGPNQNKAYGPYSHAEGKGTYTHFSSTAGHAEGIATITYNDGEHASGKYNLPILNTTLFTIGNGQSSMSRSNAFAVYYGTNAANGIAKIANDTIITNKSGRSSNKALDTYTNSKATYIWSGTYTNYKQLGTANNNIYDPDTIYFIEDGDGDERNDFITKADVERVVKEYLKSELASDYLNGVLKSAAVLKSSDNNINYIAAACAKYQGNNNGSAVSSYVWIGTDTEYQGIKTYINAILNGTNEVSKRLINSTQFIIQPKL